MKRFSQKIIERAKRAYPKVFSFEGYLTYTQFCEIERYCDINFYKLVGQNFRYTIRYKAEREEKKCQEEG